MSPARRRGDAQPTAPVAVVLATPGRPVSAASIEAAARLAGGAAVTVVSIARIHGSAFGLPNPGLLPSRREREEQRGIVSDAIDALARRGCHADGQVVTTRNAGKAVANVARIRGARHVVLEPARQGRLRRLVEGDPTRAIRRRLPGVELVTVGWP
jgi:hypothetical protein